MPPEITETPRREIQLNLDSEQNYTLRCNASGDPHPNITWTKAGIPASKFNGSGYELHLVDVKKKDAGSYICTASNGFGNTTTATAIVNIRCKYDKITCSGNACGRHVNSIIYMIVHVHSKINLSFKLILFTWWESILIPWV